MTMMIDSVAAGCGSSGAVGLDDYGSPPKITKVNATTFAAAVFDAGNERMHSNRP
jgi:hypothetical protein